MNGIDSTINTKSTVFASITAVIGFELFVFLYWKVFGFIVSLFASYDPSFGEGIGAFVLLILAPNVLGAISAAAIAKALFVNASGNGLFYALATYLAISGMVTILLEIMHPTDGYFVVGIKLIVIVVAIIAVRIYLKAAYGRMSSCQKFEPRTCFVSKIAHSLLCLNQSIFQEAKEY